MVLAVLFVVGALLLWRVTKTLNGYRKNIKNAKASGFTYVILPWDPQTPLWALFRGTFIPIIDALLPERWTESWLPFMDILSQWRSLRKPFDDLNTEAILCVHSTNSILFLNDAGAIHQILCSQERFPKPVELYVLVKSFGRNILDTEGHEWKKHRRAMAPGFSETNNRLMFGESVRQTQNLVRHWMTGGTKKSSLTLKSVPSDTMSITLHIITAIGFGVRLLWPGEAPSDSGESDESGLITLPNVLEHGHTMSFQTSLQLVLHETLVIALLPSKVLQYGTVRLRRAYEAYMNYNAYTEELLAKKIDSICARESVRGMDVMRLLVQSTSDPSILSRISPGKLESKNEKRGSDLTKQEIFGDTFMLLFAGHETTAGVIHFMLVNLAMAPSSQRNLQGDVDATFGTTPPEEWDYDTCIAPLLGNMVGATCNEMLRIMPVVQTFPKKANGNQTITIDGETKIIPAGTIVEINNIGCQYNPKYWPSTGPSKISNKSHDIDDFVPERWLQTDASKSQVDDDTVDPDKEFGGFTGTDTSAMLFRPIPGSFNPFSSGARSCIGRRMAQIEMVTVLSAIFQTYSVELAVDAWATDDEVDRMTDDEKRGLYQRAVEKAAATIRTASVTVTLGLRGSDGGDKFIPLRIVKRGDERFLGLFK